MCNVVILTSLKYLNKAKKDVKLDEVAKSENLAT